MNVLQFFVFHYFIAMWYLLFHININYLKMENSRKLYGKQIPFLVLYLSIAMIMLLSKKELIFKCTNYLILFFYILNILMCFFMGEYFKI